MAAEPEVTQYHLTTRWAFEAPVGSVWVELMRTEAWPQWWKGMADVRLLEQGDSSGMGAYRRVTWKGVLSRFTFNMRTVKVQPRALIESVADGQLTGVGRWQLTRSGAGGTQVQHDWIVNVPVPRIPIFGPIAGLLFKWNHRALMAAGRRGLQSRVGVHSVPPP